MKNTRNISLDLMKIVACLCVIVTHVTMPWKTIFDFSSDWYTAISFDAFARWAVCGFFMIFGANSKNIDYKKTTKKALILFIVFIGTCLFYAAYDAFLNGDINKIEIYVNESYTYKYHLWFLLAYIIVLTISPLINRIPLSDNKTLKYLLLLWILTWVLPSTLKPISTLYSEQIMPIYKVTTMFNSFMIGNYIGYYILGKYLMSVDIEKIKPIILLIIYILTSVCIILLSIKYSIEVGKYNEIWHQELSNIFIVIQSSTIFCLFKRIKITNNKIITRICPCLLGVYLIHVAVKDTFERYGLFEKIPITNNDISKLITIPSRVIVVFLVSLIIILIVYTIIKVTKRAIYKTSFKQ